MRLIEIKSGSIDVRIDADGARVALVFESERAHLKLFRVMSREEATAFLAHLTQRLAS